VLATAREVAAAMAYLHANGVAHGDLTAANVLLAPDVPSGRDARGFSARVADLGLAQPLPLGADAGADAPQHGAVFAMAPEVLSRMRVSRAADVWSFGVLMWQLCAGATPWGDAPAVAVVHAVCIEGAALEFEEDSCVPECLQVGLRGAWA
jgi:serine/threonine protein kinase